LKQINQEIERLSNKFNLIEAIEVVKKRGVRRLENEALTNLKFVWI